MLSRGFWSRGVHHSLRVLVSKKMGADHVHDHSTYLDSTTIINTHAIFDKVLNTVLILCVR